MALIEIDLEPMTYDQPAKWSVKINCGNRMVGIPDVHKKNLTTCQEALEVVRKTVEEATMDPA